MPQRSLALDRKNGKKLWHTKIALGAAGPACKAKVVIAGSADGKVYACELVYLAAMSGKIYAVQRKSGELRWSLRPLANSQLNSDLVTDGGRLFVTTRKDGDAGQSAVLAIEAK